MTPKDVIQNSNSFTTMLKRVYWEVEEYISIPASRMTLSHLSIPP